MYYLAEINLILLFIALAGSITVDFAGYFDFNRKWAYSYQVLKSTTEISKSDTSKEISSGKSKIELKTTHKSRFSVTGDFKKVATKDSTTTMKKRQKDLRQETTTFSDENLEPNIEDVSESVIAPSSIGKDIKKPITSGKTRMDLKKGATNKGLKQDLVTFSDENLEVNSQEHITESILRSPSIDRGVKKPAVTRQMSTSFDDYDTTTEKEKGQKGLQHDIKIFSDESLETNSQESITDSVLTSPSIVRGAKRPTVTNPMTKSLEDYDTTTEKKKGQKSLQHDIKIFSDESLETNSQESITKSSLTLPSIGRGAKRPTVTKSLEDYDTTTKKKKGQMGLKHDITTFSDENLEANSEESITDSVLTSPSISRSAKKSAATSQITVRLDEEDATIKNKRHHKKQRHHMTTSSDEYSNQEYDAGSDLKSPSKDEDIEKSATTGITNIGVEDETHTTKKINRYKKPKKASKKIVHELSSDSQQDLDMSSLESEITTSKKKQAKSKESESSEKNLDTTTENVFNTMRPQYFHEGSMSNFSLHTIEEDPQVKYFIGHILRSALKIFSNLKNKTKSPTLAAKIDLLADIYVTRYNLFIDEIKKNKIKTTLGPQKVLLNAIDSSDHMMNRIVNYIFEDANKDSLRTSINVANEFKQAINKETEDKYTYICRMMNVCHSKSGFSNFLNEYITIILLCDESKFAEAVKAFTEVTKKIDFNDTFDTVARLNILRGLKHIENQNVLIQKTILKIIRNIIAYKNEPILIHKSDRAINSTLAILEILEAFESKLLRSDANIIIWGDLRANLVGWAHHKRTDIHDTMNNFMFYLKTALDDMPALIKKRIAHNIGVIMNRKPGM